MKKAVCESKRLFSCLWTTKKIFSAVLRMNSNSYIKNEIRASTDEICYADEIFGYASDEIKSTHPPSRRISSNEVGFHRRRRFHPPKRVDLTEKHQANGLVLFWWGMVDSNHRRHSQQIYSLSPLATREIPHIQLLSDRIQVYNRSEWSR